MPYKDKEKAKESSRRSAQKRRELDREAGICTRCRKVPASHFSICVNCRDQYTVYSKTRYHERQKQNKQKVFDHYGWQCSCCGELQKEFLTIDHINGITDEPEHCRAGSSLYWYIVKSNFPDKYQTLCYNCNCAKGKLGYCPHAKIYEQTGTNI